MLDPSSYVAAETLKNGAAVTIRALRADDRERIARAIRGLERESIYFRLFSYRNELTEAALDRVMRFDPVAEVVLVATVGTAAEEAIIGSCRYIVDDPQAAPRTAEIAFMVEEDYHGQGLAGRLLRHLAQVAREQRIAAFTAEVLAENKGMQRVFERSGLPMTMRREGGVVHVTLALGEVR
jgi:RimJ/RimL family protein N-acetyltransferase